MKKIFALAFASVLALALFGCGGNTTSERAGDSMESEPVELESESEDFEKAFAEGNITDYDQLVGALNEMNSTFPKMYEAVHANNVDSTKSIKESVDKTVKDINAVAIAGDNEEALDTLEALLSYYADTVQYAMAAAQSKPDDEDGEMLSNIQTMTDSKIQTLHYKEMLDKALGKLDPNAPASYLSDDDYTALTEIDLNTVPEWLRPYVGYWVSFSKWAASNPEDITDLAYEGSDATMYIKADGSGDFILINMANEVAHNVFNTRAVEGGIELVAPDQKVIGKLVEAPDEVAEGIEWEDVPEGEDIDIEGLETDGEGADDEEVVDEEADSELVDEGAEGEDVEIIDEGEDGEVEVIDDAELVDEGADGEDIAEGDISADSFVDKRVILTTADGTCYEFFGY